MLVVKCTHSSLVYSNMEEMWLVINKERRLAGQGSMCLTETNKACSILFLSDLEAVRAL